MREEIRTRFGAGADHTTWLMNGLLAAWDVQDRFTSIFGEKEAQISLHARFDTPDKTLL